MESLEVRTLLLASSLHPIEPQWSKPGADVHVVRGLASHSAPISLIGLWEPTSPRWSLEYLLFIYHVLLPVRCSSVTTVAPSWNGPARATMPTTKLDDRPPADLKTLDECQRGQRRRSPGWRLKEGRSTHYTRHFCNENTVIIPVIQKDYTPSPPTPMIDVCSALEVRDLSWLGR
ncbi:hypothetical protein EYF80_028949 [Liparis tanakae]|uniref:Uncharacterized protein n=1 Tax=Liparis tanakae TaxID=230148 RepID=A0A4Z2H7W1_9TELE|nr:hypothetical protein EYF80_028949 [Liparis tanakae]